MANLSSVSADKAAAAMDGHPTAPAAVEVPVPRAPWSPWTHARPERTETYEALNPQGKLVKVTRNIETGESTVEPA